MIVQAHLQVGVALIKAVDSQVEFCSLTEICSQVEVEGTASLVLDYYLVGFLATNAVVDLSREVYLQTVVIALLIM